MSCPMVMTILTRGVSVSGRSCWAFSRRYGQISFGNFQSIWQNATALPWRNHFSTGNQNWTVQWHGSEVYRSVEHLNFIGAYLSPSWAWFDIWSGNTYRLAETRNNLDTPNTDSLRWDGVGEVRRWWAIRTVMTSSRSLRVRDVETSLSGGLSWCLPDGSKAGAEISSAT